MTNKVLLSTLVFNLRRTGAMRVHGGLSSQGVGHRQTTDQCCICFFHACGKDANPDGTAPSKGIKRKSIKPWAKMAPISRLGGLGGRLVYGVPKRLQQVLLLHHAIPLSPFVLP